MNKLLLKKQKHTEPEFKELYKMISALNDFLDEKPNPEDKQWSENLQTLIDFQDSDGSFKLFDSFNVPSDAKVDFCYMPTYIATATFMKAYMNDKESFTLTEKLALLNGLKMSCAKNLWGHGFEGLKGQIEALNIFMKAGLKEFVDIHHDFCPEFSDMIEKITTNFKDMEVKGKFLGPWGESYEAEIKAINKYCCQRQVFAYGTLMEGEANHHYLDGSVLLCRTTLEGYDMYDVG